MSLLSMLAGLTRAPVRYVVIGGVAATAHGSVRVTNDLDICYDPAPDNQTRLARLLAGWQAYPRGADPGLPFIMDEVTLSRAPVLTLTTIEGDLDCFDAVAGVGGYPAVESAAEPVVVDAVAFRVLSLTALIKAKRAAGRPKDQEALLELEALRELGRKP
jgi:hypothetical protein